MEWFYFLFNSFDCWFYGLSAACVHMQQVFKRSLLPTADNCCRMNETLHEWRNLIVLSKSLFSPYYDFEDSLSIFKIAQNKKNGKHFTNQRVTHNKKIKKKKSWKEFEIPEGSIWPPIRLDLCLHAIPPSNIVRTQSVPHRVKVKRRRREKRSKLMLLFFWFRPTNHRQTALCEIKRWDSDSKDDH